MFLVTDPSGVSSSKSVDNLKEVQLGARPPAGVLKMKCSSSTALVDKVKIADNMSINNFQISKDNQLTADIV